MRTVSRRLGAVALLLPSCIAVTCAAASEQSVSWKSKPDADLLQSVYPQEALERSVEGAVRLDCQVTAAGKTSNCSVLSETPAEYGFGQAALSIADSCEFYPAKRDGAAVETAHVRIPVTFSPPPLLTHVRWLRTPSQEDIVLAYPAKAVNLGVMGAVTMNCFVTSVGTLTSCKVLSETPAGLGFADAAQDLSANFVLAPTTEQGESVAGGTISVPINFNIEGVPPVGKSRFDLNRRLLKSLVWSRTPSAEALSAAYAWMDGARSSEGFAMFRCRITTSGALDRCKTLSAGGHPRAEAAARRLLTDFQAPATPETNTWVDVAIRLWPGLTTDHAQQNAQPLSKVEFQLLSDAFKAKAYLPRRAAEAGLKRGWATVDCVINAEGAPTQCKVAAEEKPGLALGEQAVQAVSDMRIGTWNSQGESTVGRAFRMTVILQARPPQ